MRLQRLQGLFPRLTKVSSECRFDAQSVSNKGASYTGVENTDHDCRGEVIGLIPLGSLCNTSVSTIFTESLSWPSGFDEVIVNICPGFLIPGGRAFTI